MSPGAILSQPFSNNTFPQSQASGVDLDVPLVGVPRAADGSVADLAQRRVAYANSKLVGRN